ncbi:MAG: hypothetical protein HUN04_07075 [Desulfobacter sp.]|nr:MAG: hypothetical protein HUN04_07075 [Desulfobacter sp.]
MDQMQPKINQWIENGKDPRSARWQAAIETVLELFLPGMEKGRLTPVAPLEAADGPIFESALKHLDLSPNIYAAFLPPRVANAILPPEGVEELVRIDKEAPSYKIIILRQGKESRLLCAEISDQAHRPGVDIFQDGAFLGNFDYDSQEICIPELAKAVRAHAWEKEKWQQKDHLAYTVNWFERTAFLNVPDVNLDETRSFFHSPTLVKADKIDALFLLLYETLNRRFAADSHPLENAGDKEARSAVAETSMLDLLNIIKGLELIDFSAFTNAQTHKFQNEFARTVRKLVSTLEKTAAPAPE